MRTRLLLTAVTLLTLPACLTGAGGPPPTDHDLDGVSSDADCNDYDANVHPGAVEQCLSGVDEDCDASTNCDDTCLLEFDYSVCETPSAALPSPTLHWDYERAGPASIGGIGTTETGGDFTGTPTFGPGFVGDGVSLDGASWIIAAEAIPLPGDGFTLVTWVRLDADLNDQPFQFLMSNGNGRPHFSGASLYLTPGQASGSVLEDGTKRGETLTSGRSVCDAGWAQVALVYDGLDITLAIDGEATTVTKQSFPGVLFGEQPFGIGNDPNNLSRAFVGELDETMAFPAALSLNQLDDLQAEMLCHR